MSADELSPLGAPELLLDQVTHRLRQAILTGQLPPGSRVSVPDLARRLGVSRTPVREAVQALEHAGLVVNRPRRGAVVFGGDGSDLRSMFELREALDGMAARLAAERMTREERAELKSVWNSHQRALDSADAEAHIALDHEFHLRIRDGARNEAIRWSLESLGDRILLVMRSAAPMPGGMGRGVRRDHGAILKAVVAGDGDAAEAGARSHVRNILRVLERNGFPGYASVADREEIGA